MRTFALCVLTITTAMASSPVAFGQAVASQSSRAEINAETKAAEKSRQLTPAGDAADFSKPAKSASTKTRADRKAETRLARKQGDLEPAGEAADVKAEKARDNGKSTKTRADRKAETLAARKAGTLTPAGEGPAPTK